MCHSSDTVVWVRSAVPPQPYSWSYRGMCAFLTGCVCIWRLKGEASEGLGLDCPVFSVCCIGVSEGAYVYMAHLRAIDGKRPVGPAAAWPDIQGWSQIMTPMVASEWERLLASHSEMVSVSVLVPSGVGVQCQRPSVIDTFLATELAAERVLGLVDPGLAGSIQVNRFGLVPRGHEPDKWRLIVDLSFPGGSSVNDGIGPELCGLRYTSAVRECWSWARVQCWQNLTCPVLFGRSQSIPTTVTCWVCGGGATLMWIKCCLLASGRPPSCTMWWQTAYYGFW